MSEMEKDGSERWENLNQEVNKGKEKKEKNEAPEF